MIKMDERIQAELILLRTKLEIRTWILRASLALNTAFLAGVLIKFFL